MSHAPSSPFRHVWFLAALLACIAPLTAQPRPAPQVVGPPEAVAPQSFGTDPLPGDYDDDDRWSAGVRRFEVRQTVSSDLRGGWRDTPLEVRARFAQDIDRRGRDVVVTLTLEALKLYERGRYLGEVSRFPRNVRTIRLTQRPGRPLDVDRMLYLVGDAERGFDLLAARSDDEVLDAVRDRRDVLEVAILDGYRDRADLVRDSRYYGPGRRFVPFALVPDAERLLYATARVCGGYDCTRYGAVYGPGWGGGTRYGHDDGWDDDRWDDDRDDHWDDDDRHPAARPRYPQPAAHRPLRFSDSVTARNGRNERVVLWRDVELRPLR